MIGLEYADLSALTPVIDKFHRAVSTTIHKSFIPARAPGRRSDGLIYVISGRTHYDFGSYAFDAKPGDIFFLARDSVYSMDVYDAPYVVFFANFDFRLPPDTALRCALYPSVGGKNTEKLFRRMREVWCLQRPTVKEDCLSMLYAAYSDFLRSAHGATYLPSAKRKRMDAALEYIDAHIADEALNIAEVASAVHLSESHFRRSFRDAFGISPVKYITMARITQAQERLRYSNERLTDIAEALGFSSLYYFSVVFKKEAGTSPSEYRKRYSADPLT